MTMAKIPELPWSNGRNWSTFLTIDHGVNSRVSWSWSVPTPSPLDHQNLKVLWLAVQLVRSVRPYLSPGFLVADRDIYVMKLVKSKINQKTT